MCDAYSMRIDEDHRSGAAGIFVCRVVPTGSFAVGPKAGPGTKDGLSPSEGGSPCRPPAGETQRMAGIRGAPVRANPGGVPGPRHAAVGENDAASGGQAGFADPVERRVNETLTARRL